MSPWGLILVCLCAGADAPTPVDVYAACGNGGLTVTANAYGRVTACRWPSPGYNNQVSFRPPSEGRSAEDGLMWGLRIEGKTYWLTGDPWAPSPGDLKSPPNVVETLVGMPGTGLIVKQTTFVHPQRDVLVTRLTVTGSATPPVLYWYANFTPCTRLLPEVPIADSLLDSLNDFAAFHDESDGAMYHFRPTDPGSRDWDHAERLARSGGSAGEWSSFRDGVWIAYRSPDQVVGYHCGRAGEVGSAWAAANDGALQDTVSAAGACNSAIEVQPAGQGMNEFAATVFAAFGTSRESCQEGLKFATDQGYAALLRETQAYWEQRLAPAALPVPADPALTDLMRRCLTVILNAMDRESGAIVRTPLAQPQLALDWVREGVWTTLALDDAGYHDLAQKHLQFYCDAVRKNSAPGAPAGSLPRALYANGKDGLPHVVLDVDSAAWLLWLLWQHAQCLEVPVRTEYLNSVWATVDLVGDFVQGWVESRTGLPYPSFDAQVWRDTQSVDHLLSAYTGVAAADGMAQALRQDRPEWIEREGELRALAMRACLDAQQHVKLERPLPYWPAAIVPTDDPRWDPLLAEAMLSLGTLEGEVLAASVCDLAVFAQSRPELKAQLREQLLPRLKKALRRSGAALESQALTPDALIAARCFIAAHLLMKD